MIRKRAGGRALAMLVASLAGFLGSWRHAVAEPGPPDAMSRTSRGMIYTVSLATTTFRHSEPIRLEAKFENGSRAPVTIWISGFWPNHRVVVKDKAGQEPALTKEGEARRKAFAPQGGRDKNAPHILNPGEIYRDSIEVDLNRLYRLGPSHYTVEVTYEDDQGPTPLRVTSKAISFEIK